MKNTLPGGMPIQRFIKEYWQKKPLLIRNAFPNYQGIVDKKTLINLAQREDAQSRLITYSSEQWNLFHGPFTKRELTKPTGKWTLLVQDINHFLPEGQSLLNHFNFIPHARLDDLMISFATDGAGVGAHLDSYDVFLLQGSGKRLWQIAKPKDQSFIPDLPLRILKKFTPEEEWLLEPGDMLYLPPQYAHNGIAVGECMTYSIGFRAPSNQELINEFLFYLQDHLEIPGMYTDPDLKVTKHPALISDEMINKVAKTLKQIKFGKNEIKHFLGMHLSKPKANVFFDPIENPVSKNKFFKLILQHGISLSLKTQMLFTDEMFFLNGEAHTFSVKTNMFLKTLANKRINTVSASIIDALGDDLYEWYLDGYLIPQKL